MKRYWIILGCLLGAFFYACSGGLEEEETVLDRLLLEKSKLKEYLSQNVTSPILAIPFYSRKGLVIDSIFVYDNDANGQVVQDSGWVMIDYVQKDLNNRMIDGSDLEQVDSTTTYLLGGPIFHRVDTSFHFDYKGEALRHIGVGKSGKVLVPSSLGNQDGNPIIYEIKSYKVFTNMVENENQLIQSYRDLLASSTLKVYEDTLKGRTSYTHLTQQGTSQDTIAVGDSIMIANYGFMLDEFRLVNMDLRQFEGYTSYRFLFNEKWKRSAPLGLVLALMRMHPGDKAEIVIPYTMGYGIEGYSVEIRLSDNIKKKQYVIPPFATLLYRLELQEIKKAEVPKAS